MIILYSMFVSFCHYISVPCDDLPKCIIFILCIFLLCFFLFHEMIIADYVCIFSFVFLSVWCVDDAKTCVGEVEDKKKGRPDYSTFKTKLINSVLTLLTFNQKVGFSTEFFFFDVVFTFDFYLIELVVTCFIYWSVK